MIHLRYQATTRRFVSHPWCCGSGRTINGNGNGKRLSRRDVPQHGGAHLQPTRTGHHAMDIVNINSGSSDIGSSGIGGERTCPATRLRRGHPGDTLEVREEAAHTVPGDGAAPATAVNHLTRSVAGARRLTCQEVGHQ